MTFSTVRQGTAGDVNESVNNNYQAKAEGQNWNV